MQSKTSGFPAIRKMGALLRALLGLAAAVAVALPLASWAAACGPVSFGGTFVVSGCRKTAGRILLRRSRRHRRRRDSRAERASRAFSAGSAVAGVLRPAPPPESFDRSAAGDSPPPEYPPA